MSNIHKNKKFRKFSSVTGLIVIVAMFGFMFKITPALALGTNGSFETGTAPGAFLTLSATNSTDITGWTVDGGDVDYVGTYWSASDGTRSLDMNGTEAGSISQILPTVVGDTYNVSFDLSGNPSGGPTLKDLKVSATGATSQDFPYDTSVHGNSLTNMMWQNNTYSFTATTTSTTLTFASQTQSAYGPALDNVSITDTTPEQCDTPTTQTLVSDTTNTVVGPDATGPAVAVGSINSAWENPATLGGGATWIWDAAAVSAPTTDQTSVFTKTFNVSGTVTSAAIDLAADNGYIIKVNGTTVDNKLAVEANYGAATHYDLTSFVVPGANTLEITVKNFAVAGSTSDSNPAGLLYKMTVTTNCTVTPPTTGSLTVTKNTTGGDGTFNFTGVPNGFSITTSSGTGSDTINGLTPGTFTISETPQDGWTMGTNGCSAVVVSAGQTATCTIMNTKSGGSGTNVATTNTEINITGASTVNDQAMVSGTAGTPTGNVDFHFYNNDTCTGDNTASFIGTVPLVSGVASPSASEGPLAAGSYSFKAVYNGDGNYSSGAWSSCEPFTIGTSTTPPPSATISGTKYNDKNRNGKRDPGEPGLKGWTIDLDMGTTVVATTTTDANGNYSFTNVAPGTYKVREVQKLGWKRISKNPKPIVITTGSIVTDVNFGNAVKYFFEKEDTKSDDDRDDQSGFYYTHHDDSDYQIGQAGHMH